MKLSIIVPVYNSEKYLKQCLDSILDQTFRDFELILINDGSTDSSDTICKEYAKNDNRIKYYSRKNCGVSATRNYGIRHSSGNYVIFIDSDDYILHNNYFETFYKLIQKYPNHLICCGVTNFEENKNTQNIVSNLTKYDDKNKFDIIYSDASGYMCNRIFSLDILKKNNILFQEDIKMCEDLLFNLKYLEYCNGGIYIDTKSYYYRINESNASRRKNNTGWFTIFYVIDYLLSIQDKLSPFAKKKMYYFCKTTLIEAKFRNRRHKSKDIKNTILLFEKKIKQSKLKTTKSDSIKIIIYKYFTGAAIKYRLRAKK